MSRYRPPIAVILLAAVFGASCRTASSVQPAAGVEPPAGLYQPGAPGQATRAIGAAEASDLSKVQATPADVQFMQGMIGHHSQAVEMAGLLPSRTASDGMKMLGLRIDVSQADEIDMMQSWLKARGQEVPGLHAHHMQGATMMPGMLSPEDMERLTAAKGVEFDRLFLEGMIKHHIGALTMVRELFEAPGAGQEADINAFASDVDADQRMEIDRMSAMLKELQK